MDDLVSHGFDVWAFDFAGFGGSERYPEMNGARGGAPLGRAVEAAAQIADVVEHIVAASGRTNVSLVAHSWGTIAASLYAAEHPERVAALCLFGPIAERDWTMLPEPESLGRWRLVTVEEQLARFIEDVPAGHPAVLIEPDLEKWGPAYLASDRNAETRTPPAVEIPSGPQADILEAWRGALAYKPKDVVAPTLIVRGEWDRHSTDGDADWILSQSSAPVRRDIKIPKGTHLMHLERSREGLFLAVREFLERGQ